MKGQTLNISVHCSTVNWWMKKGFKFKDVQFKDVPVLRFSILNCSILNV